jgi:hypothetical protein
MRRDVLLAAALAPPAFTSYLLSLGVRPWPLSPEPWMLAAYIVVLGSIGVLVTEAHRRGLLVPLPVATALLLLVPWFGVGPTIGVRASAAPPESLAVVDFLLGVSLVGVLVLLVAALEFTVLESERVREVVGGRTSVGAVAVGVVYAPLVLSLSGLNLAPVNVVTVALSLWTAVGLVALGAVPVYVAVRLNRLSPPAIAAAGLAFVALTPSSGAFSFGVLYAIGWVLPLGLSLLAAAAEGRLRHQVTSEPSLRV